MLIGGKAALVHIERQKASLFLWATESIPALSERIFPGTGLDSFYDRLLPPLVFLRWAGHGFCWESPTPTARVTVDDPLLVERYGFLDFGEIARSLERLNYGLTIAFIPWNHCRTKPEAARFFSERDRWFSICIHGCDHTNNEFGITDARTLEQKASLALARMIQHQQRTGLPFERVMVFPQGRFSKAAMWALRRNGYLAAVNSNTLPLDEEGGGLTLADELQPATNRFSGFPLFHRRYPKEAGHFAVDLFLGKPAHVVEHHQFFRHGCTALEHCVSALKEMDPRLSWPALSVAFERIHQRRQDSSGVPAVRFFTNRFILEDGAERSGLCRFSKPEPDPELVQTVRVNDRSIPFARADQCIQFELELKAGERVYIQLGDRDEGPRTVFTSGVRYRLKTGARRYLSEFRDNYLARHPAWLKGSSGDGAPAESLL